MTKLVLHNRVAIERGLDIRVRRADVLAMFLVDLFINPNNFFAFEHCSMTCLRQVKLLEIQTPKSHSCSEVSIGFCFSESRHTRL